MWFKVVYLSNVNSVAWLTYSIFIHVALPMFDPSSLMSSLANNLSLRRS